MKTVYYSGQMTRYRRARKKLNYIHAKNKTQIIISNKRKHEIIRIYYRVSLCRLDHAHHIQRPSSLPNLTKHVLHKLLAFHTTIITNSSRLQKLCRHQTTKTYTSRISYTVRIRKKPRVRGVGLVKSFSTQSP